MTESKKKIVVFGAGYVGMSMSALLAQKNQVIVYDIDKEKVLKINAQISPVEDSDISKFLSLGNTTLRATVNYEDAIIGADFVIIATPTDFDVKTNFFNTKSVEESIKIVTGINKSALIIIKSTVPIGFTENQKTVNDNENIFFSPEFLREGSALRDNLNPSRVILGGKESGGIKSYEHALYECSENKNYVTLYMPSTEAESVKLFSNTYLAMRVAFFNELDNFALTNDLDTKLIIDGVALDPRVGEFYHNPSFGYGGYCLPKDTKQLLSNYKNINQNIIEAIVKSNETRKSFLANVIVKKNIKNIGIYRLAMKEGSDNYRQSAIIDIIDLLKKDIQNIYIFEPMVDKENIFDCLVIRNIDDFKMSCDLIITNRMQKELEDVSHKVFTRDIYNSD
jgi:UDPglucose 6-dehydrogenase